MNTKIVTVLLVAVVFLFASSDSFAWTSQFAGARGYQYISGIGVGYQKHSAFANQKSNCFGTKQFALAKGKQGIIGYGWLEQGEEVSAKNKKVGWSVYAKNSAYGEGFQQIIGIGGASQEHKAFAKQRIGHCENIKQFASASGKQYLIGAGSLYQEEYVTAKNVFYTHKDPMNIAKAGGYQEAEGAAVMGQSHNATVMQQSNWFGTTQTGFANGSQFMAGGGNMQQAQSVTVIQVQ